MSRRRTTANSALAALRSTGITSAQAPAEAPSTDTAAHREGAAPRPGRLAARLAVAAALIVPLGSTLAVADGLSPTTPTTPDATTPAATTPVSTTPTLVAPNLSAAATAASVTWTAPPSITEERSFQLKLAGTINGRATAHIALLDAGAVCPASPLYPQQLATGLPLTVVANPDATPVLANAFGTATTTPATTPSVLGGLTSATLSLTPKDSGTYRLCGWLVGSPAFGASSTVAQFDQVVGVANRAATLNATIPDSARSADYFPIKVTGSTDGTGRRVLIMGEPDHGQTCAGMRKLANGKRPLQSVTAVTGTFTKTIKVRFASKTSGPQLVCVQLVETVDRNPEALDQHTVAVSEALKCTTTQAAITQTVSDLKVIRGRRDAALARLTAAKKKLKPLRAKVSKQRALSNKRIATARKALTKAKSPAGRKKASRHLAAVKKTEARRVYNAGTGLRRMNSTIRSHQRTYNQYRTGANLLSGTLTRTKKDLTKYCSPAGRSVA